MWVKLAERETLHLLYQTRHNHFISFNKNDPTIRIFDHNMQLISKATTFSPVSAACQDEHSGDVYFGCTGQIASYTIRRGKIFTLKSVYNEGLPTDLKTISCMTIESNTEKMRTRLFAAFDTTIAVLNITGGSVVTIKDAHSRTVTSMLFFDEIDSLVTASKDGSIKMWDSSWKLVHVFDGHDGEVTSINRFPALTLLVSTSIDATLKLWNVNTLEMVDDVSTSDPILGAGFLASPNRFYTYTADKLNLWLSHQLQLDFAVIGETVRREVILGCIVSRCLGLVHDPRWWSNFSCKDSCRLC
jgi:WD40 repeat protein